MRQLVSEDFVLQDGTKHPLVFVNGEGHKIHIYIIADHILRVLHTINKQEEETYACIYPKKTTPNTKTTTLLQKQQHTLPNNNHNELPFQITSQQTNRIELKTQELYIIIDLCPFGITWQPLASESLKNWFAKDLIYRSYCYDDQQGTRWHYQVKKDQTTYYGLGERTGGLNLSGRRFRLERYDSMGYDAQTQDPLYKFCPFYLALTKNSENIGDQHHQEKWLAYGIYYNNFSRTSLDFGQEKDAMWGDYTYYQVDKGPIDYYMIYGGESVQKVSQSFGALMGGYTLMPKSMFGYLASSMGYAESENAQEQLEQFIIKCRQIYQIPCDGMHLSSGYTVQPKNENGTGGGDRWVFTWNHKRFPDPIGLAKKYRDAGMRIFANVKPWLLETHPDYTLMKSKHGFVWKALSQQQQYSDDLKDQGQPGTIWQWRAGANTKGKASYIDFTSHQGYDYWQQHLKSALLDYGYDIWLDNNEFTMTDDTQTYLREKQCNLYPSFSMMPPYFSANQPGHVDTPIQTLLMIQSSYEVVQSYHPKKRPCLITRSTVPFCQSLVSQTWSGDNFTEWKTLAYNIPMGTGANLSAQPAGYGHDVGGFAGNAPSEEQLVRWVQQGIFWTRFCIHSYNSDHTITEPWMYPNSLPIIRSSIEWRYKWIPNLYSLYITLTYRNNEPVIRPTFYDHPQDLQTHQQDFEFMVGSQFLVAPVYEQGKKDRRVYLPKFNNNINKKGKNDGWYHYQTGQYYESGNSILVPAPLTDTISPLFIKEGSFLCFGKLMQYVNASSDNERYIHIYPPPPPSSSSSSTPIRYTCTFIEDDGESTSHEQENQYTEIELWMECDHNQIKVGITILHDGYIPDYDTLWVTCPLSNEKRSIVFDQEHGSGNNNGQPLYQSKKIDNGQLYNYQGLNLNFLKK